MPQRILFVGMYPDKTDVSRNVFFRSLIYAMADQGVHCTVIAPVKLTHHFAEMIHLPAEEIEHTPGGHTVRVLRPHILSASARHIGSFNTGHISELLFEQGVRHAVKSLNETFDAVYGHFLFNGGLTAIKIGRELGIPSFFAYGECSFKTEVEDLYGPIRPEQLRGLAGIIAVSTKNKNELLEQGIFHDIPMLVAPNSIDAGLFFPRDRAECRRRLGLPEDRFIVGFVGTFKERKGDKRLLEAVNRTENVWAAFAGASEGETPPGGERVLFCRSLPHEEIPIFLNAADVFCLPTLNEGSCNALVEAMACGVPVVSSDLPFNDDVLTDENSIRLDPRSVDEIEAALRLLSADPARRKRLGERALETARSLTLEQRAEKILCFMGGCMK